MFVRVCGMQYTATSAVLSTAAWPTVSLHTHALGHERQMLLQARCLRAGGLSPLYWNVMSCCAVGQAAAQLVEYCYHELVCFDYLLAPRTLHL